jgi:hypothetical protein
MYVQGYRRKPFKILIHLNYLSGIQIPTCHFNYFGGIQFLMITAEPKHAFIQIDEATNPFPLISLKSIGRWRLKSIQSF